jgi:hypothetical protein
MPRACIPPNAGEKCGIFMHWRTNQELFQEYALRIYAMCWHPNIYRRLEMDLAYDLFNLILSFEQAAVTRQFA